MQYNLEMHPKIQMYLPLKTAQLPFVPYGILCWSFCDLRMHIAHIVLYFCGKNFIYLQ